MCDCEKMVISDPTRPYGNFSTETLNIAIRLMTYGWVELDEEQQQRLEAMQDELDQRLTPWSH